MRLERLNSDKIKIFLTFDDLQERGLSKEDLWSNLPKVQDLFREMIMEADDELGFHPDGPIEVEVFSLPAQGMVIIVSKSVETDLIDEEDDFIELQVTLDESDVILYRFNDIEDVISFANKVYGMGERAGQLFSFDDSYYLEIPSDEIINDNQTLIAVLAEYAIPSTLTHHRLVEYGKPIIKAQAVEKLYQIFTESKKN